MMVAAATLAPASSSIRFTSHKAAARLLSFYTRTNPTRVCTVTISSFKTLTTNPHFFPPSFHPQIINPLFTNICSHRRKSFCTVTSAALSSSGETVEKLETELIEKTKDVEGVKKVKEFKKRLRIVDVKGGPEEGLDRLGQKIVVKGWVRTLRIQSSITFLEVNDGSCMSNMQCVLGSDAEGYDQVESGRITTGASVSIEGIIVSSQGSKQKIELKVAKVETVGECDPSFPIQKKRVTREFLRTKAHLRPRTNTFGAVARVRNALAYATHQFFQENGFTWVSSPIITASDCEGAGEQFCVTTLISSTGDGQKSPADSIPKTQDGSIDWSKVSKTSISFMLGQEKK